MILRTAALRNGSVASPEPACEQFHRTVPVTFEVIRGRACESCAHELKWGQILAELSTM